MIVRKTKTTVGEIMVGRGSSSGISSLQMKTGRACATVKSEGKKAYLNDKITEPLKHTNDGGNPSIYR